MKLLTDYLDLQKQLFDYFGYVEDWRRFAVTDRRGMYWWCDGHTVGYSNSEAGLTCEDGDDYYESVVYTYRHLKQLVYPGAEHTMVLCDTGGNIWLSVFDNALRRERE